MEGAQLRRVPSRPPGRVDPAEAIRYVTAELSALDAPAVEALALIALAGRSRGEVAGQAGLSGEELGEALARARKALRRKLHPLPGTGWCERAERLISDRIDEALEPPGPARLEVHLANCSRCVEHERRLAQAQDGLVSGFTESTAPPPPPPAPEEPSPDPKPQAAPEPVVPPAALRIVDPSSISAPPAGTPVAGADPGIALPPAEEPPKLPEAEEPAELPEGEATAELPEAERTAKLPEPEDSRPEPEPPESEPAAARQPSPPAQVVPMPIRPRPPEPAPRPYVPPQAPQASPPVRAPDPARARLAATYSTRPLPDGSRSAASDDTWAVVAPLLAIVTVAVLLLVFGVLAVTL